MDFDAVLLLSFGGPEGPEQVRPFLENVTRGRGIPPERLDAVAEHYLHFGGVSPINGINRALIEQLRSVTELPVYFGNRNWEPYAEDTVKAMRDNGVRRAAVFTISAWDELKILGNLCLLTSKWSECIFFICTIFISTYCSLYIL